VSSNVIVIVRAKAKNIVNYSIRLRLLVISYSCYSLLILDERGIRRRIASKWLTRVSVTGVLGGCAKDNQDFIPISNSELEFGYIVLVFGFLSSAVITLFEYYLRNRNRWLYD